MERTGELLYVEFSCPVGEGGGVWCGEGDPEKRVYDVELDFELRLGAGDVDNAAGESIEPSMVRVGEQTKVRAKVEAVDADGMAYPRLHTSCIVMVESDLPPETKDLDVALTLNRDQIALTPFGI